MIYDFSELKELVRTFGINPDLVNSKFQAITEILTRTELDKNVDIESSGIYYKDKNGNRHKGFLFIEKGYNREEAIRGGWNTIVPKFHISNCITIQEQKRKINFDGHYVFSNQVVKMEDLDGSIKELLICKNCVKISNNVYNGMSTSNYRDMIILNEDSEPNFIDSELPKDVTTDLWGYTSDWDEQSKNYRIKKRFTCENCGIELNKNIADGYYLETHHLDGNKLNNNEENLKCLCVLCHSFSNDYHIENYSRGSGKQKLIDFIKLFEDKLKNVGNEYLGKYKP